MTLAGEEREGGTLGNERGGRFGLSPEQAGEEGDIERERENSLWGKKGMEKGYAVLHKEIYAGFSILMLLFYYFLKILPQGYFFHLFIYLRPDARNCIQD